MSGAVYVSYWQVRDLIGVDATAALLAVWGGGRVYIPGRIKPDHPLVEAIGRDAARQLCAHFAGGERRRKGISIELPRRPPAPDPRLDFLRANPGLSMQELANTFGVHGRTIRRLRARLEGRANVLP